MSETVAYIFEFNVIDNTYTLTGQNGQIILIDSTHKKFEWLQKLDTHKIVKINASGRWNSSKDYHGVREMILNASSKPSKKIQEDPPAQLSIPETDDMIAEPNMSSHSDDTSDTKQSINIEKNTNEHKENQSLLGVHDVTLSIELTNMLHIQKNDFSDAEEATVMIKSYSDLKSKLSLEDFAAGVDNESFDELLLETAISIVQSRSNTFSVKDIQTNMKVGYNRASRIHDQLAKLSIIEAGFGTDLDPKDNAWPLLEKITCTVCQGEGQTYHTEKQKTGFLKLKTKEIQVGTDCKKCDGKGYFPKIHYPYTLDTKDKELTVDIQLDLDPIVKIILDTYISETDFTDQAVIKLIQQCDPFKRMCEKHIQNNYNYKDDYHSDIDLPMQATWKKIQELNDEFNKYLTVYIYSENIKPIIKLLFKLDILDISTKRRSTKDENTYYKLTKKAKKLYSQLD